jgi:hypothetical protein
VPLLQKNEHQKKIETKTIAITATTHQIIDMIDAIAFVNKLPNGAAENATFIGKLVVTKENI